MRRTAALLTAIVLLGGPGTQWMNAETWTDAQPWPPARNSVETFTPEVQKDIDTLRDATAHLRDFDIARDFGGWSVMITGCMDDAAAGGMGFHYGNPRLFDDSVR